MIKSKKKYVALLTSLAMIFAISVQSTLSVSASTAVTEGNNTQTDNSNNESTTNGYYDSNGEPGYVVAAYLVTASGLKKIDYGSFVKAH